MIYQYLLLADITNIRYADDTDPERKMKELLDNVKSRRKNYSLPVRRQTEWSSVKEVIEVVSEVIRTSRSS